MKSLIISADDFGLTASVNEAVEIAHRAGLLSTASLMVAGSAAEDAISRAHANPTLKVGLHLVLVEGKAVLPPAEIPALVDAAGNFSGNQVGLGFKYALHPTIRLQLAREIRAQYKAFKRAGLELDHLNAHKHMHLHPTVAALAIEIGRDYGLKAIRIPRAGHPKSFAAKALAAWTGVLRWQARRAGLVTNDTVCGLAESGHMNEATLLTCLATLPEGITEAYFHPATCRDPAFNATMPDYDHPGELAALLSQKVRDFIATNGIALTTYSALAAR